MGISEQLTKLMRKKLHILLAVLVLMAVQGCAGNKVSVAPKTAEMLTAAKEPVRIVCFGDSITGTYYHTGSKRAYPEMLQIALERVYLQATVRVINAGKSGDITSGALARIEKDVLVHRPGLVTVMFGMNDMKLVDMTAENPAGTYRVPISEFHNNLVEIIKRCRHAGAEVLLCGQNSINDSPQRTNKNLIRYIEEIKKVGREQNTPVIDFYPVYKKIRDGNPLEWMLLMSDNDIHPNMNGHKLFAEQIAGAVSGRKVSLDDIGPPCPSIPQTLSRLTRHTAGGLNAGKPVRVLAMPPYDILIEPALREILPIAEVNVTAWPVAGKTISEIAQNATELGTTDIDLVIIAVPVNARADSIEQYIESYNGVLNWAVKSGEGRWDCVAIPPSTTLGNLDSEQKRRDRLARRIIKSKDIGTIVRQVGDLRAVETLLMEWLKAAEKVN